MPHVASYAFSIPSELSLALIEKKKILKQSQSDNTTIIFTELTLLRTYGMETRQLSNSYVACGMEVNIICVGR